LTAASHYQHSVAEPGELPPDHHDRSRLVELGEAFKRIVGQHLLVIASFVIAGLVAGPFR
jgi:hypothetical protein